LMDDFILVVDDNDGVRHLLKEVLTQEGFKVRAACNGDEALQIVHQSPPLLIILDLKMPGTNGCEVLKRLKAMSSNIPVIMITAYTQQKEMEEALDDGLLKYFLHKPFELSRLREMLQIVR